MKEKGLALNKEQDKIRIRISDPGLCKHCNARLFCIGGRASDDTILAYNPIGAEPGDTVEFEIPQSEYNRLMIKIFGLLLLGIIGGSVLGYIISLSSSISQELIIILFALLGLIISGFFVYHNSRKKQNLLFPIITRIIKKGERNE
ncbi:SoxR reducing system RseC family protein [Candidatus Aminicenantes bacterium AC-335-K20]|jgi:positive regulator of sigma E activity|nr:SoxR reducing system RseC family protein [SCandidatus Aminicenantes bacterium Aminicenantia_JdfR_composite]MCP2605507.1 SoxR reducing system RseC family protein [Candidatus Aminicenantes bacterium AC-335-O07]MCP2618946.1 SoxR reducing system RseC family protein [Candidatus Aminicenantes bacterium AC-335-A11]MCP2619184.1 SoxR reducing system RseC family protein [Candidatus Aminicenantes bacterium AC-335-K20]MCP2620635.1 SoxR reducing system RseC family protein [Candidatus Aminicenantes bacter